MSTYVVTGGAGFIGSHITQQLLAKGHAVRIIDNFLTGKRENVQPGAQLLEADIRDLEAIRPAFEGADGVFHTAALARVQYSIEHPQETNDVNINGTLNVLLAARDAKVKRLVYSASSSAYGDAKQLPLHEEMLPRPMSPYGLQKYVGEHYARISSLAYGLETVSLRYFNVYGPRMSDTGAYVTVMSVFARQKKQGVKLSITGDGTQTRDFTNVADVARANILAMESPNVGAGEVINIGGGDNKTINEIAQLFGGEREYIPPRLEPHDTLADISKARELLGWEPTILLEEGIKEVKEFFQIS